MRKLKRLGNPNRFNIVRPGDLGKGVFRSTTPFQQQFGDEEDAEEEQLPTTSNLPPFEPLVLWADPNDPENKIEVIPELACRLRPHQREGVQFLFECAMGMRGFDGQGCILADDMGLGKTLMSITALWTLINQGFVKGEPAVKKVMVVCPTSLVGNWDNEIRKWVGERCPTFAVKQEPKKVIKSFLMHRGKGVLIVSYETQRLYSKLFEEAAKRASMMPTSSTKTSYSPVCDMIICDEAHKLKNAESELSKCLSALPARKRILLSGTPMQNELTEFFNMVNFCNPGVLGTVSEFRRNYERPILASREPDALESEIKEAGRLQKELSVIVNEFILKRGNILNAQHLPPKLVQFVCCRLTPLQEAMYGRLLSSKEIRHIREGKQTNTLNSIRQLINICSHPQLILDQYQRKLANKEDIDDDLAAMVEMIPNKGCKAISAGSVAQGNKPSGPLSRMEQLKSRSQLFGGNSGKSAFSEQKIDPEQSGKMAVLFRMMQAMRAVQRGERIVVVSNYTSTLDLIEAMCQQQKWPALRLDGTVSATKRTKLVEEFNNPNSNSFAFLLSSKAGGCGINLIGGNRLVLFDPDWNPASDKQAAGRIWREGQKRRCFIYRFMSSGSIEEKIIQRQLSKEGLVDIVDDKEQVNQFSSEELRQLFTLLKDTRSDTHDTLLCPRCTFVKSKRDGNGNRGPKMNEEQQAACLQFLRDFESSLQQESVAYQRRESIRLQAATNADPKNEVIKKLAMKSSKIYETLPFKDRFEALYARVQALEFENLTAYSRKQREFFQEIDNDLSGDLNDIHDSEDDARPQAMSDFGVLPEDQKATSINSSSSQMLHYFPASFSVYAQFLRQWTEIVPNLMIMGQSKLDSGGDSSDAGAMITNEGTNCVEQEGCPEETDMNKWSHHCSPLSCDDELFAKALGDDDGLVSFIFGLEVNWSLLEKREAETRDEKEQRKLQQIKDLEELNAKRRALKERALRGGQDVDDNETDDDRESEDTPNPEVQVTTKKGKKSIRGKKDEHDQTVIAIGKKRTDRESIISSKGNTKKKRKLEDNTSNSDESEDDTFAADDFSDDMVQKQKKKRDSDSGKARKSVNVKEKDLQGVNKRKAVDSAKALSEETYIIPDEGSESFELDVFFENDRRKLHKLLSKGKLQIPTFDHFWKVLKTENNDWRCMLAPGSIEIFCRTPGLKLTELRKYKRNVDFFVETMGLLNHFVLQCRLRDDEVMADLLQRLLPDQQNVPDSKKVLSPTATPVVVDLQSQRSATKRANAKKNSIVFSDEEIEEQNISKNAAPAKKKITIIDEDEVEPESKEDVTSFQNSTMPVSHSSMEQTPANKQEAQQYSANDIISFSDDEQDGDKNSTIPTSGSKRKRSASPNERCVSEDNEALPPSATKRKVAFEFLPHPNKENLLNNEAQINGTSSQQSSDCDSFSQDTPWTCEVCTFINESPVYVKKCQICK